MTRTRMGPREAKCFALLYALSNRANVTHANRGGLVCNHCDADLTPLMQGTFEEALAQHKENCPFRMANEFCMEHMEVLK